MLVKTCPRCSLLMWVKDEALEYPDPNSVRVTCPHCHQISTFKLVTQGENAAGPKMGH